MLSKVSFIKGNSLVSPKNHCYLLPECLEAYKFQSKKKTGLSIILKEFKLIDASGSVQ